MSSLYLLGIALATICWIALSEQDYKDYFWYSGSDEYAYKLMRRIILYPLVAGLWPGWLLYLMYRQIADVKAPVRQMIDGSIRHSAKIKQHSLDDKTSIQGNLSMVEPIGEGNTGRYDP